MQISDAGHMAEGADPWQRVQIPTCLEAGSKPQLWMPTLGTGHAAADTGPGTDPHPWPLTTAADSWPQPFGSRCQTQVQIPDPSYAVAVADPRRQVPNPSHVLMGSDPWMLTSGTGPEYDPGCWPSGSGHWPQVLIPSPG